MALRVLFFMLIRLKNFTERVDDLLIPAAVVNGEYDLGEMACVFAVSGEVAGEIAGDVVGVVLENATTPGA